MTTHPREDMTVRVTFDPDALYVYTWPGQTPKSISGKDLNELCRGADPESLSISLLKSSDVLVAEDLPPMSLKATDELFDGSTLREEARRNERFGTPVKLPDVD